MALHECSVIGVIAKRLLISDKCEMGIQGGSGGATPRRREVLLAFSDQVPSPLVSAP